MHFPGVVRWWKLSRSVYTAFPFNFVASPGEKAAIGSLVLVGAKSQSFGGLLHSPFDGRVDCRNAVVLWLAGVTATLYICILVSASGEVGG